LDAEEIMGPQAYKHDTALFCILKASVT